LGGIDSQPRPATAQTVRSVLQPIVAARTNPTTCSNEIGFDAQHIAGQCSPTPLTLHRERHLQFADPVIVVRSRLRTCIRPDLVFKGTHKLQELDNISTQGTIYAGLITVEHGEPPRERWCGTTRRSGSDDWLSVLSIAHMYKWETLKESSE